jgi:hypothetical protein
MQPVMNVNTKPDFLGENQEKKNCRNFNYKPLKVHWQAKLKYMHYYFKK